MKVTIFKYVVFLLFAFAMVACKKHFTKGTIRVFDVKTGKGIEGVKVIYDMTLFDRRIGETDGNGELHISGIGNLYDMELYVDIPGGFPNLDYYEVCGFSSQFFLKDEVLEIPLIKLATIQLELKRNPKYVQEEVSYQVHFVDTHCQISPRDGASMTVYWQGEEPEILHRNEPSILTFAHPLSSYAKRVDIYSPSEKFQYVGEDTIVEPDTSFYISPPYTEDTIRLQYSFD